MTKTKRIISIVIEFIIAICGFTGVILSMVNSSEFMSGSSTLLYFTIQSNIWICTVLLVNAVYQLLFLLLGIKIPKIIYNLRLIFTVSITLTGLVFCTMLAPFLKGEAWTLVNILTHVIVPTLSIVDLLAFGHEGDYSYKKAFLVAIPPVYYLIFSLIGYFANWNFGGGKNYPYAFLNYGGSAGVFGFSTDTSDSLYLGSFYWIIILVGFVIGVGMLYTKILFLCQKKKEK